MREYIRTYTVDDKTRGGHSEYSTTARIPMSQVRSIVYHDRGESNPMSGVTLVNGDHLPYHLSPEYSGDDRTPKTGVSAVYVCREFPNADPDLVAVVADGAQSYSLVPIIAWLIEDELNGHESCGATMCRVKPILLSGSGWWRVAVLDRRTGVVWSGSPTGPAKWASPDDFLADLRAEKKVAP